MRLEGDRKKVVICDGSAGRVMDYRVLDKDGVGAWPVSKRSAHGLSAAHVQAEKFGTAVVCDFAFGEPATRSLRPSRGMPSAPIELHTFEFEAARQGTFRASPRHVFRAKAASEYAERVGSAGHAAAIRSGRADEMRIHADV